tara:strand:+ start:1937 stop:2047 length:111 start_codon:yes stop_codon:yes gene_type:complete
MMPKNTGGKDMITNEELKEMIENTKAGMIYWSGGER